MKESTRSAPGPALAPEVPSDNTYSNTLKDDTITCESVSTISKTWDPVKKDTGTTDANGNAIYEYVDYVASGTIEDEMEVKNLSSDYYRDLQSLVAKGSIKCTSTAAKKAQRTYDMDGGNLSSRATPSKEIAYYRSQFLVEVVKSLNQKNLTDTVVQDYQIAWSCGGVCQELTNTSASSCRPVYVSELLLGLESEAYYYASKNSSPKTFPTEIISAVASYYSSSCSSTTSCYSSRSKGKNFSPLSKDLYKLMYQQLVFIPKGNLNSEINVYNYSDYSSGTTQKTTVNRVIPGGASASHQFTADIFERLSPSKQSRLPNSSLCNNVGVNSEISRDNTVDNKFILSATDNNFANVSAGNSHTQEVKVKVVNVQNAAVESVAQSVETGISNLVPFKTSEKINKESFASTTSTNKNSAVSDPYRPDIYIKQLQESLRPSSWL